MHFSAATQRGEATLRDAIVEAAEFALEREGAPKIPAAWGRVKAAIEALRERDQRRPIAKRRHRTMTSDEFAALSGGRGAFRQGLGGECLTQRLFQRGVVALVLIEQVSGGYLLGVSHGDCAQDCA